MALKLRKNLQDLFLLFAAISSAFRLCYGVLQPTYLAVNLTLVEGAVAKGAVCLDGSPPAYHWDRGFGSGTNNWVIGLEGGGWCHDAETCIARSKTHLGSSKFMGESIWFTAILHNSPDRNPYFYNWNRVLVRYCDGSSFTGDVSGRDPRTGLYFRGYRIWTAVMRDLLGKGLSNAKQALLTGCSAGGLSTLILCDKFRGLLPQTANVKCMSDAGFFLDQPSIDGKYRQRTYFYQTATLHRSLKHLPANCTSTMKDPSRCFFPQYFFTSIKTPLFILNSAIDSWQIRSILAPMDANPSGSWKPCEENVINCRSWQIKRMNEYRDAFLKAIAPAMNCRRTGMFINSCYAHCQSTLQVTWHSPSVARSPKLNGKTIAESCGDWFVKDSNAKAIDYPFPYDSTCRNFQYTIHSSSPSTVDSFNEREGSPDAFLNAFEGYKLGMSNMHHR